MSRPEFVKCIRRAHVEQAGESWCGRRVTTEFCFGGIDHAAENGKSLGRLVACPACVAEVTKALNNGAEDAALTAVEDEDTP